MYGRMRNRVAHPRRSLTGRVEGLIVLLLFGIHDLVKGSSSPIVWIETAVELNFLMLVYAATACILGLYVSLNSRKNVTAVMYSVGVVILGGGITSLLVWAFVQNSGGAIGAFFAPLAPFTGIMYLVHPAGLFTTEREFLDHTAGTRFALLLGSAIAVAAYVFLVWRFYTSLVRNFDMTLRKQSA